MRRGADRGAEKGEGGWKSKVGGFSQKEAETSSIVGEKEEKSGGEACGLSMGSSGEVREGGHCELGS